MGTFDNFEELTSSQYTLLEDDARGFEYEDTLVSNVVRVFPMSPATEVTLPCIQLCKTTKEVDLLGSTEEMPEYVSDFTVPAKDILGFCNLVDFYTSKGYNLWDAIGIAGKTIG